MRSLEHFKKEVARENIGNEDNVTISMIYDEAARRFAAHVWEEAKKAGFMIGAKYGYEYHQNTQFPEKSFEDNVKGNVLQILESDSIDKIPNMPNAVNPFKK